MNSANSLESSNAQAGLTTDAFTGARHELTLSELAKFGFASATTASATLSKLSAPVFALLGPVLGEFREVADPDVALAALSRVAERHERGVSEVLSDAERCTPFLRVLGVTSAAESFFLRNPEELAAFECSGLPSNDELMSAFAVVLEDDPAEAGWQARATRRLRVVYRRMLFRIVAVDVMAPDPCDIVTEISDALARLADVVVDTALAIARRVLSGPNSRWSAAAVACTRLAVIAMGKTGAEELNYSSDVDLIYVGQSADPETASDDRAVSIARDLAVEMQRGIEAYGPEPPLWPIDTNLRPEGKDGALVRTLASHVAYYKRWAKGWEFQALIKARPMAGDRALGTEYCAAVSPMVWASSASPGVVTSVQRMRERVIDYIPQDEMERELKLGPGGIRDIEFTVQLLQLVHGQHDDRIRDRATLAALHSLAQYGYIGRAEATQFGRDYRSLRVLEHRVQLRHMSRTHLMPLAPAELRVLARSTHLMRTEDDVQAFWRHLRHDVRSLHEQLFYRPLLAAVASLPGESFVLSSEQAKVRLAAIGYRDANGALTHIAALTKGVSRRAEIQRHLLPIMLEWFAEGVDPDNALLAFRRLSEGAGQSYWYLRMLRDSRSAARRLASVLSMSRFAADQLVRMPQHVAWLGDDAQLAPQPEAAIEDAMMQAIDRHRDDGVAAREQVWAIRRREVLRVAIAAICGLITTHEVGTALSDVATAELRCAVAIELAPEAGVLEWAVIAMGRFGGREMGFSSDVDLMYVYRAHPGVDAVEAARTATQVVARISTFVNDPVYPMELDLGLRPEGKSGAVARSLAAYEKYYARWSAIWESQALLRARPIAGSAALMQDFEQLIDPIRYPRQLGGKQIREIRKIKARVERERLPRGTDPKRHFKLGTGSLTDVEWLVQLIQLRYAAVEPSLQTTSTLGALQAAVDAEYIHADDAVALSAAWTIASRARSAAMLAFGRTTDVLPSRGDQLEAIARILGYEAGNAYVFENDYLKVTRVARAVFERLFYADDHRVEGHRV